MEKHNGSQSRPCWLWRYGINPLIHHFVCNSRFTASELLAHGIPPRKVRIIRNTAAYRLNAGEIAPAEPTDILFVGQLIPEKGVDLLLEAVALLHVEGLTATLGIVGDLEGWVAPRYAGYRESLMARAQATDLSGRVRFFGWREDVPQLMALTRVHCCPSRPEQRESSANVVIEAKTAGVPSVVTATGSFPELIHHREDGWIWAEVTPRAIADGLRYFLTDPARLARAAVKARESLDPDDRARFEREWREVFACGR